MANVAPFSCPGEDDGRRVGEEVGDGRVVEARVDVLLEEGDVLEVEGELVEALGEEVADAARADRREDDGDEEVLVARALQDDDDEAHGRPLDAREQGDGAEEGDVALGGAPEARGDVRLEARERAP